MNVPLLQQEKSATSQFSLNAAGSPDKKMAGLFGAGILKKYEIKNELVEKVQLPITVSEDFLEKSVVGINYNKVVEEACEIYDTSIGGRLSDSKKIFEGIRTKQQNIMKEHNFVSSMSEYNNIIYLACKDGTILVNDQRAKNGETKRFVPHNGKDVLHLYVSDGFLVSLSVGQELIIWDVKHFIDSDQPAPDSLMIIDKVTGFELITKNQKTTLYYFKDSAIYETQIEAGKPVEDGKISIRALDRLDHAVYLFHANDGRLLFADKYENVYLLTPEQGDDYQAKLLVEKSVGTQVKCARLRDEIVTVVQNDTQSKETIFTTINLLRLKEDEEEAHRLEEEQKRKAGEEDAKRQELGEEAFRLWKMQQHQLEASEAAVLIKKKETGAIVEEMKEDTKIKNILPIGECGGVSFSSTGDELLVSGQHCFIIYSGRRWENQKFEIKNDTTTFKTQFSSNGKSIFMLDVVGILKTMEWRNPDIVYPPIIKDKDVQEVVGSRNGKYFATLSNEQTRITVYGYNDCSVIGTFDNMDYTYLMNFSADSSSLVCVQGTEEPQIFNVIIVKLFEKPENQIVIIPCKIAEDYITQIDASLSKQEIYMISKTDSSANLHVYGFDRRVKKTIRDAVALSVSTDEKLLAYSNTACQIHMIFIKMKLPDAPKARVSSPKKMSLKGSPSPSPKKTLSQLTPAPEIEEKVSNTIELPDNAYVIQFYGDNLRIAIQTASAVVGMDVYTHEIYFKIQASAPKFQFKRIQVQFDDFINFCDSSLSLCVYDINYYLETDFVSLKSQALKKIELQINPFFKQDHAVWATVGNHLIMNLEEKLWFCANPFMHNQVENEIVHSGPYESIEGFFIPTLLGGPKLGSGTFAEIYNDSCEKGNEDITILKTPIYPYKVNALHYFAMTNNVEGAEACFANKVKFCLDQFGKSPLDYAIQTQDKLIIECILTGIDQMENDEKIRILRTLPLNLLVEHPAPVLANILLSSGASVPIDSKFGKGATVPSLFPIKKQYFGESGLPYYSCEVAAQLHPAKYVKPKAKDRPVSTFVLNNPVPRNFTEDSLELLASIQDCSNDEIVRSKPITLYLNRKWDVYAYNFYFFQFIMFITLLMALTVLDSMQDPYLVPLSGLVSVSINTYFFIFEILQLFINGLDYFKSFNNLLDIGRLAAIYTYLFSVIDAEFELPFYVLPTTFFLMWFKILNYLQVFKPTRYLIKMIFEIIGDITTFLIILFTALFAYCQITYVLTALDEKDLSTDLVNSYVFSLGELGGYDTFGFLQFFIFMMFSFLVPLVLMNMLIALMADSYTRVQSNSVAADARALAEMIQEMEEVAHFVFSILRPSLIKNEFYYCFMTKVNDEEEEEDWEGTVGQLKRTIEEATTTLEQNLINAVDDMSKKNTEKIIDNLLRANKSELDVIDQVQRLLEKETGKIRTLFEEQMLDESQKVKDQFTRTLQRLEDDAQKFEIEFRKTHEKLAQDYEDVKGEFKKTQQKMAEDSQLVQDEFKKTKQEINTYAEIVNVQGNEVKSELKKAHEEIEMTSKQLQSEIKVTQEKQDTQSKSMKDDLKRAQEMITDVNSSVQTTSSQIVQNVQQSTNKTSEQLLKKIEDQSKEDTGKVESQVEKQTKHHNEMVTFAVDTQKKVTDLLLETAQQQTKLLTLVDELKGMQNKGLESIRNSEQELIKKKDFENAQQEAVAQIQKYLADIKAMETTNLQKHEAEKKIQEEKEAALLAQIKTIQTTNLAISEALGAEGQESLTKEVKLISKIVAGVSKKLGAVKKDDVSDSDDEEKKQGGKKGGKK